MLWRWELQRGALVTFVSKDDVTLALKHEWLPQKTCCGLGNVLHTGGGTTDSI